MSTKTSFKRLALGVVVAMGLGFLSSAPSTAVVSNETLSVSGTTGLTAVVNESTTAVTATVAFFASAANDSRAITASVSSTSGGTATVHFRPTGNDTVNATLKYTGANTGFTTKSGDTVTATTTPGEVRATFSVQAFGFSAAGVYTINIYTSGATDNSTGTDVVQKYVSFTVTVTAASTEPTTIKTYTAEAGGATTSMYYKNLGGASSDSAVVVSTGTAGTYTPVAVILSKLFASNGDTVTGTAKTNICNTVCLVDVTIDRGFIDNGIYDRADKTPSGSETITIGNRPGQNANETITVYSGGNTAGVATITYRLNSNGALLGTSTVTFAGSPASVSQMYSNDTITSIGATLAGSRTLTLNAIVKDSGGSTLKSGVVWVYSSDTKVAGSRGATATTVAQSCTIGATGVAACAVNINDTGTATLTIRDSHTVAASTWVSSGWTVTVTGETVNDLTVAFDKSTYSPGERAVITITAKDVNGRLIDPSSAGLTAMATVFSVDTNKSGYGYETSSLYKGTQAQLDATKEKAFAPYETTGVETRVITMPTASGPFTYGLRYTKFGGTSTTLASASATVADPTAAANAAAIAAAQAASDAATDAANEAIDAANAATDAANLAAEAADAATVAAEEARDAADAATAAVEELATQVATLMAALKAQLTTLANTVAKIAKKLRLYAFTFLAILATVLARVVS